MKRTALEGEAMSLLRFVPEELQTGNRKEDYRRYKKLLKRCKIAGLRQHVMEMQLMLFRSRIVCNCWHLSDKESDAMWKVYGDGPGVMLVSTVGRLSASIKGAYSFIFCSPNPQHYTIAPVRYVDESDLSKLPDFYIEHPWLLKRKSFAHEQEIRVSHQLPWVIDPQNGGMLIEIDSEELISEIVLSPFNPSWANRPLGSAIQLLLTARQLQVPLRMSDHMAAPASSSPVLDGLQLFKLRDLISGGRSRSRRWKLKKKRPPIPVQPNKEEKDQAQ